MNKSAKLIEILGPLVDPRTSVSPTRSFGGVGGGTASDFELLQKKQDQELKRKNKNKKDKKKGIDPLGFRPA